MPIRCAMQAVNVRKARLLGFTIVGNGFMFGLETDERDTHDDRVHRPRRRRMPDPPQLFGATIEVETRGGYTLKLASQFVKWEHLGKDGDVLRWRVAFPARGPKVVAAE